jgi:glyoxylase I family protein
MVSDASRSMRFYVDQLGFEPDFNMLPAFASVKRGDLSLWLAGPNTSAAKPMPDGQKPEPGGWNRFVVEVDDVEGLVDQLYASGAHFRNEIISGPGGKQVLVDDPDGNPIELFERHK